MARHTIHKGRKIEVQLDVSRAPDGREIRRDVILHPGAVVILPLLADGRVCLLRNFRFVLGRTLWEVPAGTLEPDEPPEQAAVRDLAEETGYSAGRWQKLGVFYPSPGVLTEAMHLFVAHDLTPGPAQPEADEQLEPVLLPWDEAVQMATDGRIHDLKTVATLLLWDRLRAAKGG